MQHLQGTWKWSAFLNLLYKKGYEANKNVSFCGREPYVKSQYKDQPYWAWK